MTKKIENVKQKEKKIIQEALAFTMNIIGKRGSGKTTFVVAFIKNLI